MDWLSTIIRLANNLLKRTMKKKGKKLHKRLQISFVVVSLLPLRSISSAGSEHHVDNVGVTGSNPVSTTKKTLLSGSVFLFGFADVFQNSAFFIVDDFKRNLLVFCRFSFYNVFFPAFGRNVALVKIYIAVLQGIDDVEAVNPAFF